MALQLRPILMYYSLLLIRTMRWKDPCRIIVHEWYAHLVSLTFPKAYDYDLINNKKFKSSLSGYGLVDFEQKAL